MQYKNHEFVNLNLETFIQSCLVDKQKAAKINRIKTITVIPKQRNI